MGLHCCNANDRRLGRTVVLCGSWLKGTCMLKLVDTKCHCWLHGHRASATSLGVTNLRYVNDYVGSTVHALL